MQDTPPGDREQPAAEAAEDMVGPELVGTRAIASAVPPSITAPLSVEKPPRASGGPAAALASLNDTLRKPGLRRGLRVFRALNQDHGFVCPGCAWPNPERRARFEICEAGVRAVADESGLRRAGSRLFETYTIPELGRRSDHWLASQGRLTDPMIRRATDNSYHPIAWDEALALVGAALAEHDPRRAMFYASARAANEPAFVLQLLARALGTNNLASSSELCHEASRIALREVLGDPGACVSLADFDHAEAIFVFGSNPGSNHPRMLSTLRAAKLRGAKVVAINPLREASLLRTRSLRRLGEWFGEGTPTTDLLLPVAVAGDLALIVGLGKAVIEADAVDREALAANELADFEAAVARWSWAEICEQSGLDEAQIRAAADIYIKSKATIFSWGLGLTQHRDGVATVAALLSLLRLRGNVGKPGAGPLALLGHNNTRGCWTMGVEPSLPDPTRAKLAAATGLEIPDEPGLGFVDALAAMERGEVDVLVSLGGNLLSAAPDTERVAAALRRCKLTVHIATKLNRAHLITGETALLLPCLARSEVDPGGSVSVEDMTGVVRSSTGRVPAAGPLLRSEVDILLDIAARAAPDALDWAPLHDRRALRRLIAAAVPDCEGFADALERDRSLVLRKPSTGGTLACPPPPGRNRAEGEFLLTTVRAHDQHNSTIYSAGDRDRGIEGYRRVVLMNLADIQKLGIEPFDQVDLCGDERVAHKWVAVPHHIPEGNLAAYWPEANVLVPTSAIDPRSRTPAYKSVRVTVRPSS